VHLAERIQALALERLRFGDSRVHDMLPRDFLGANRKKAFRHREQGRRAQAQQG
jgi:putative transposase